MLLDLRTSTSAIYPLSYTTLFRSRPREPDAREIARQHVLALRSDTALDPRDEIVEGPLAHLAVESAVTRGAHHALQDRKSTRLNSSHLGISYAVFCLKKKTKRQTLNFRQWNRSPTPLTQPFPRPRISPTRGQTRTTTRTCERSPIYCYTRQSRSGCTH